MGSKSRVCKASESGSGGVGSKGGVSITIESTESGRKSGSGGVGLKGGVSRTSESEIASGSGGMDSKESRSTSESGAGAAAWGRRVGFAKRVRAEA